MFVLDANNPESLTDCLRNLNWMSADEKVIGLSTPGAGNMNCVLRVDTGNRTFIIKQSRAYVEKYPQVAAPEERVIIEAAFYDKIIDFPFLQDFMPKKIGVDVPNKLMAIEDLGPSNDFTILYQDGEQMSEEALETLLSYLSGLHKAFVKTRIDDELVNNEMRLLNHEHIFKYPFMEANGFDLDTVQEGLQKVAMPYKKNAQLRQKVEVLGGLYLSKGKHLLHGDYYPGSWLQTEKGIKVIDPEFCFYGSREFDLAVFIAHLYLSGQDDSLIAKVADKYEGYEQLNKSILNGFVGTEIMRRLIGLAQLPLKMDLKRKKIMLDLASKLILNE
ncbi:phosphotransferase [Flavobacterium algicola]|uniref:phosphotransferase n=1 Tax=Flavobacterium algicola TaxID=556529 RepID=UPI001EFE942D|nr:phosphotransferase [Flavobacterium algicola]MCG9792528.1 phosphotransferase [Flavobacterium algicola]